MKQSSISLSLSVSYISKLKNKVYSRAYSSILCDVGNPLGPGMVFLVKEDISAFSKIWEGMI